MKKLYYIPPSDDLFEDIRTQAIALWGTMGDEPTYSQEKIARIKDIGNIGDNFMYILAMFDSGNQRILASKLQKETINAINERLESVDNYWRL